MHRQSQQLLTAVAKAADTGRNTMRQALAAAPNAPFAPLLAAQAQWYEAALAAAASALSAAGGPSPAPGNLTRLGSFFILRLKTMEAGGTQALAAALAQGLHESVVALWALLHRCDKAEAPARAQLRRLLAGEERCYEALKPYL